jgi:YD repeat-containing protein
MAFCLFEYHDTGELKKTYSARTYPVEYAYDDQGRKISMTSWQQFDSLPDRPGDLGLRNDGMRVRLRARLADGQDLCRRQRHL